MKIRAVYHHGVLEPLEPLPLAEDACVEVTIEPEAPLSSDDILRLAGHVYKGFDAHDIAQVEGMALNRQRFFREPA
jgi:predicted DNA-binding antitoxin AbrB/MazE fold protein